MFVITFAAMMSALAGDVTGILVLPEQSPHRLFAGNHRAVTLVVSNTAAKLVEAEIRIRQLQVSAATTTLIKERSWKRLQLFAGQSVNESVALDFPVVRSETRFLIQWIVGASNVIGVSEVMVYSTNLLVQLKTLAGDEPLGVFDPADTLKPLLRAHAVEFQDLIENGTDKFRGKLAIFGPFESKSQMRASLRDDVRALAKLGVAVVWLLPPPEKRAPLKPSFRVVREAEGAVVVAAHDLVTQLAERPEAQLNLLRLAEEALHPTPLTLPETETSN